MSWFSRKKNISKADEKEQKVDRILVEDYIDQGFGCKEIAEMCKCDEQAVYNIKNAKQRREMRMGNRAQIDDGDPISKAKAEFQAAQIQFQIDKLNFERDKLAQEKREFFDGGSDGSDSGGFDGIAAAILSGMIQRPGAAVASPIPIPTAAPQQAVVVPAAISLSDEEIENVISNIDKKFIKMAQMVKDDGTLIKLVKGYMPNFSDDTYQRAINLVRSK